jgi:hypothetical protein
VLEEDHEECNRTEPVERREKGTILRLREVCVSRDGHRVGVGLQVSDISSCDITVKEFGLG